MNREQDIKFIEQLRKEDNINAIDMLDEIILQHVKAYEQKVKEAILRNFIDDEFRRQLFEELGL